MSLSASSATERLVRSRQRLQRALLDAAGTTPSVGGAAVIDMVDAVNEALRPTARRHPLGLVAGAVLAGGLLAWIRPWRWAFRSAAPFNGLCRQLVHDAVAQAVPQVLSRLLQGWPRVPPR